MYLARKTNKHKTSYYIRASYADSGCFKSRDLFDLGSDPSRYIIYPGGHGYYYDDSIKDALADQGFDPSQDDLDNIFWEFLDPEIRRVIEGFERTDRKPANRTCDFKVDAVQAVHLFDKRRILYLKFGEVNQHHLHRASPRLFAACHDKSRDELEQMFLMQERILSFGEKAAYVYGIFDLQQFFREPATRNKPGRPSLTTLDEYFIEALCQINADLHFWAGMPSTDRLREYLIRYAIMFFDFELPRRSPMQEAMWAFINRHRRHRPPPKVQVKMEEAGRLFGVAWKELKAMKREALTRLYRQLALKHHPDCGGDPQTFIQLTTLYEALMDRKND